MRGMAPARILFLAANPKATAKLQLDEELRTIQLRLRTSGAADRIEMRADRTLR